MSKDVNPVHYFGIRHHGPGCARSLLRAFDALQPDCVLVEGPPDAQGALAFLVSEQMAPPVALLSYCPDEPQRAVYHPFAVFSPEWQALRWALLKQVPVSFIDLPVMHQMAMDKAQEEAEAAAAEEAARKEAEAEKEAEAQQALQAQAAPGADNEAPLSAHTAAPASASTPAPALAANAADAADALDASESIEASSATDNAAETAEAGTALLPDAQTAQDPPSYRTDPLNWLAQAAGHADGESWWNHTVEERGDGEELFAAIAEAMTALRADLGEQAQEFSRMRNGYDSRKLRKPSNSPGGTAAKMRFSDWRGSTRLSPL